jgi:putative ABC transport system permease protein
MAGLAITIALCSAMFSVVNGVAFGSLSVRDPSAVYRLAFPGSLSVGRIGAAFRGQCGYVDYLDLKKHSTSMTLTAAAMDGAVVTAPGVATDLMPLAAVSGDFFQFFGVKAALGRTLGSHDDAPGVPRVAVLTSGFWTNWLGGDPDVIGKTIQLDQQPFTVVGVLERSFNIPVGGGGAPPAVWTTLANARDVWRERKAAAIRRMEIELNQLEALGAPSGAHATRMQQLRESADVGADWNVSVDVIGRLSAGASKAAAEAEMSALAKARLADHGKTFRTGVPPVQFEPIAGRSQDTVMIGAILMTVAGLLVLLACANVTNLLLANAITRVKEIGTRLALGARRARVVRQLLTESLLLGVCSGTARYVGAVWLVPVLQASLRTPLSIDVSPDLTVYAFVVTLILAVGIATGLAPASFGRRDALLSTLNNAQAASASIAGHGLRSLLIGAQAAISVVLLVIAGLLTQSVIRLATIDIGYDVDKLMVVSVGPGVGSWNDARQESFWRAAPDRMRQVPGIAQAALVSHPPFSMMSVPRLPNGLAVNRIEASAEYFETLGLPLVRGRSFTVEEIISNAPVAVISQTLAERFWKTQDPIGSTLERVWGKVSDGPTTDEWTGRRANTRVVGVVAHGVRQLKEAEAPTIFLPLNRATRPRLLVRAAGIPSEALAGQIRDALRQLDADAAVLITYPRDNLHRDLAPRQALAALGSIIGLGSVLLAVIGISGVAAFLVAQRRREIGIRLAIGATPTEILRTVLQQTLTVVMVGAAVGLVLAFPAARMFKSVLIGVSPGDPIAIAAALALFTASAVVAALVPARRALDIDVVQVLSRE